MFPPKTQLVSSMRVSSIERYNHLCDVTQAVSPLRRKYSAAQLAVAHMEAIHNDPSVKKNPARNGNAWLQCVLISLLTVGARPTDIALKVDPTNGKYKAQVRILVTRKDGSELHLFQATSCRERYKTVGYDSIMIQAYRHTIGDKTPTDYILLPWDEYPDKRREASSMIAEAKEIDAVTPYFKVISAYDFKRANSEVYKC